MGRDDDEERANAAEAEDMLPSSVALRGLPLEQLARLDLKELTQLFEGLGMEAAEPTAGTGESVCTGVSQVGLLRQLVGGDAASRHEFVDFESHH